MTILERNQRRIWKDRLNAMRRCVIADDPKDEIVYLASAVRALTKRVKKLERWRRG